MRTSKALLILFMAALFSAPIFAAKQIPGQWQRDHPGDTRVYDPGLAVNAQIKPYIPDDLNWTNQYGRSPQGTYCGEWRACQENQH